MTTRATPSRIARVGRRLTDFDLALVTMLTETKLASGDQLRRVAGHAATPAGKRAGRRQLARLTKWGVLERLERRVGGLGRGSDSYTYGLGLVGQRLAHPSARGRRPHLPRPAMWAHILISSELYALISESVRGTDRTIAVWQGEPAAWRSYTGPNGETLLLKPDAYVVIAGPGYEDMTFVECDTGTQSPRVISSKLAAYEAYAASGEEQRRNGVFPRVVFVTTSEDRYNALIDLFGRREPGSWRLFTVSLVADASRRLLGDTS